MIPDPITLDSADTQKFAEAIDYFRRQAPWISGSSWDTMGSLATLKGDQVSGASLLGMVDDLWRRMDRAVDQGLPYSDFVREIGRDFRMDWAAGVDSSKLKLIYHNNVGSALMAGRMRQMTDPDVVSDRPYLMFDAIEDMRTSQICLGRDDIKKRADDPWWKENTPLLHHNCRSSVISLDEEDLQEAGGLTPDKKTVGLEPPGKGWGSEHSWEDWKPDGKDYHPVLFREWEKWSKGEDYAHELEEWRRNLKESWSQDRVGPTKPPTGPTTETDDGSFDFALMAYKNLEDSLVARGLDPNRYGISRELYEDLVDYSSGADTTFQYFLLAYNESRYFASMYWAAIRNAPKSELGISLQSRIIDELESQKGLPNSLKKVSDRAMPEWRDAKKKQILSSMIRNFPFVDGSPQKDDLLDASAKHLIGTRPDLLMELLREGTTIEHDPKEVRAYAERGFSGRVVIDLGSITKGNYGGPTLQHELWHRLDNTQDNGDVGGEWDRDNTEGSARAGKAFQAVFKKQIDERGGQIPLPNESSDRSRYMHAGTWVNSYEARIYSDGVGAPSKKDMSEPGRSGPIEFVAMAGTYYSNALYLLQNLSAFKSAESFDSLMDSSYTKILGNFACVTLLNNLKNSPWHTARRLYGTKYTSEIERWQGGARDALSRLSAVPFVNDADIHATAVLVEYMFGIPLEDSVGPGGVLASMLKKKADLKKLKKLRLSGNYESNVAFSDDMKSVFYKLLGEKEDSK